MANVHLEGNYPKGYIFATQMSSKPTLVLLSHEFPFGNSETSFIEPELPYLYSSFNLEAVITLKGEAKQTTFLEKETKVIQYDEFESIKNWSKKKVFLKMGFWVWLATHGFKVLFKQGYKKFKSVVSQMVKYYQMAAYLNERFKSIQPYVLYSYWFDHWSIAASIYKRSYNPKVKIVSRAHRYEIDEQTAIYNTFPYLGIQAKNINLIAFISKRWKDQFVGKRPSLASISQVHRMGVPAYSGEIKNPSGPYQLLSISGNIPVKRMELQAEILNALNIAVEWHHFGAHKEDNSLHDLINNPLVSYFNHGFVPFQELLQWIEENPVHYLMNTSAVEGIPVSMMECLARGVPLFAIDVGGVSEIVNEQTGVLCEDGKLATELAQILEKELQNYPFTGARRKTLHKFQKESFLSESNYVHFCKAILKLQNT